MGAQSSKQRRIAGSVAVAAAIALALAPEVASAFNSTMHNYNGPAACQAKTADGKVRALQPGECAQYGKAGQGRTNARAKNVILIIGDGMGQQEITAARNYLKGAGSRFEGIDELPNTGLYTHHSVDLDGKVNYVTDSAASATAWSTGTKTYNGAISVDLKFKPLPNLLEKAKLAGMRTGNITTSEIQDATPAAQIAHNVYRKCYGPDPVKNPMTCNEYNQYREQGGLGSISEQLIDTRPDVTMGGGMKAFKQLVQVSGEGKNPFIPTNTKWEAQKSVLDNAKANGFQVVTTADELRAVKSANQDQPLLGLFADGNMKTRFASSKASLDAHLKDPQRCEKQDLGTQPELPLMFEKAVELLDDKSNDKGFFLQVESASIDKRNHASDACGMIGETERLDDVTKQALDFARADGNTMVIVTADHSHTAQIVYDANPLVSPATRLMTADGASMTVAYGTIPASTITSGKGSTTHTGAQLRIAGFGPGSENVLGQTDQTDLHYTILNALGLNPDAGNGNRDGKLAAPVAAQNAAASCYLVNKDGKVTAPAPGDCAQYGTQGQKRNAAKAKNVILFIGDGMGDSEITIARNYLYGASGRLPGLDALPYTGNYTHYALNQKTGLPDYVTDSAASGTAWATGTKTYNGAIGVDNNGKPVANLIELAKAKGLKTGNVTTAEIQDATPAVQGAHALNRKCYGPELDKNAVSCQGDAFKGQWRTNGGLGSISEQLVDTRADVTLGGGAKYFDQKVAVSGTWGDHTWTAGTSVLENAKANGYQVATNAKELAAITQADQSKPVLGLFASGNLPRKYETFNATVDGAALAPKVCEQNPKRDGSVPDAAQMTRKALELLRNDKGFFLQVEAASIDKADHQADVCGQIGETDDLDRAIQVARDWVKETGEPTLIIATADHAHTSQIIPTQDVKAPISSGIVAKLKTADDSVMMVNYATAKSNDPKIAWGKQNHTGTQLRIAAEGPGAQNVVGQLDQTDLHFLVANALDLRQDNPFEVKNLFVPKSDVPVAEPTKEPSAEPTKEATKEATAEPTKEATAEPTKEATAAPTKSAPGAANSKPGAKPSGIPGSTAPRGTGSGSLAATGSDALVTGAIALLALTGGAALLVFADRRRKKN
ncbi:alkaline phosphatase [Boudabousia liubingyangii]|uniref:Alkaline phosphatase n=1 Tax=Boudabousia liubingyangii TaxID=1921764 RepID=A0A1Q5PLH8_9ACTO|nr:alkaline phosphatase [Boudabousia liubingyangii]OKL47908.1 alkaline phosphatase [Boudabousia liubingyangii]